MSSHAELFREYIRLHRKRAEGLTPEELEQWKLLKRVLNQEFAPDLADEHADRRESVRVPTSMAVSFGSLGALRQCLLTNVSRGGVFIQTDDVLPIGTVIDLHLRVEETGDRVEVPAEVVSHNVGPQFEPRRGMGLRFLEVTGEQGKKLDDLYESALRKAFENN